VDKPAAKRSTIHLRNALIADGTGSPAEHGDVLVQDGRIAAVGSVDGSGADAVVDLSDLVLAPGFIDSHTHYDAQVLWDPDLTPSSNYGITSVLMGNCGYSLAPTREQDRDLIVLTLEAVEGMSKAGLEAGIDWSFETFAQYLDALRRVGTRLNVGAMAGHTTIRSYVMGPESIERAATPDEVARMGDALRQSLEGGAIGFSTSRSEVDNGAYGRPVGSRVADYAELMALAGVVGDHGRGIIQALPCSMRDGPDAIAKVVADLARVSGRPVLFSSLLTGLFGPSGAALDALDTFGKIDGAYPGVACMPLVQQVSLRDPFILPLYSAAFVEALEREPSAREALYADPDWQSRARSSVTALGRRLAEVVVAETTIRRDGIEGHTLGELAQVRGVTSVDVMVSLALEEHLETRFRVPLHNNDEDELEHLLRDPRGLLGLSDAGAHQSQICDAVFSLHLLQHWVRELGALPLEFAVWRLTGHQAQALELADRGTIAPGMAADLVAFDPASVGYGPLRRVHDLPASADRLIADSIGIEHVWVNGEPIRRDHVDLPDARPGQVLTSSPSS
jgi:N-acyl-D-amino-acid deacylase